MIWRDRQAMMLLAASLLLRCLAASAIGPGFDEAYYSLFAKNLAWGYFDHPPFVAFTAGLGYWLTGVWTPLTLRLGAILVFTVALAGFYQLGTMLYGRKAGILALLIPHATPFFTIGAGAFVVPDNALVACWVWALVVAAKLRRSEIQRTFGFFLLGILAGLSLLAKYHAVLLPASLVIASIYDKEMRKWWLDWRLYMTLVVAILVFSPCIYWNSQNEWISFAEQFGKGTSGEFRLRFDLMGQAIGGQFGYMAPWVAIPLWIVAIRRIRQRSDDLWLLAFFFVPVVGMSLIGLTRPILPHWTMPGYISAMIVGAGVLSTEPIYTKWSQWTKRAVGANVALIAFLLVQANFGIVPLPDRADPTLDPHGWKQVVAHLEKTGDLREGDVIFVNKWFSGGELGFAQEKYPVVLLGSKQHMFAWWAPEVDYRGRNGVFIAQKRYTINPDDNLGTRFEDYTEVMIPPLRSAGRNVKMVAWRVTNLERPQPMRYGPSVW